MLSVARAKGQAQAVYNQAYGKDGNFFDFYRSLRAYEVGLTGNTTTIVGSPNGSFFRFFQQDGGNGPESPLDPPQ